MIVTDLRDALARQRRITGDEQASRSPSVREYQMNLARDSILAFLTAPLPPKIAVRGLVRSYLDESPTYRSNMRDAGRGHLLR
jgi:hypothetical protein